MVKYRVFTNDVGPLKFSAFRDINAATDAGALIKAARLVNLPGVKILALPHHRPELWPDGKTGAIPEEAKNYMGTVAVITK